MSHHVTAARRARRSTLQEEWNVGSEPRGHPLDFLTGEFEREHLVHAHEESRRVAAPASQTRRDRNALREPYAHAAGHVLGLGDQGPSLVQDVGTVFGNGDPARLELKPLASFLEDDLVLERYGLQDRVDLVVSVRTPAQD